MLLTIALLLALSGALITSRVLAPAAGKSAAAGWMSDKWLAEQRASRLT
jgi:hypothetical protein